MIRVKICGVQNEKDIEIAVDAGADAVGFLVGQVHVSPYFSELVCSNSLRSDELSNAVGLLKEELRRLADDEYAKLPSLIKEFGKAFQKQWMKENKPFGYEYWAHMFGGLEERAKHQRKRLLDYLDGKTDEIEELSWELLPYKQKEQSWWYKNPETSIGLC